MAKPPYFLTSDGAWLSEERQRFGSSADAALRNQDQQAFDLRRNRDGGS
jgi:hypothetical protein